MIELFWWGSGAGPYFFVGPLNADKEWFIIEWRDKLDFPPIFFEMGS